METTWPRNSKFSIAKDPWWKRFYSLNSDIRIEKDTIHHFGWKKCLVRMPFNWSLPQEGVRSPLFSNHFCLESFIILNSEPFTLENMAHYSTIGYWTRTPIFRKKFCFPVELEMVGACCTLVTSIIWSKFEKSFLTTEGLLWTSVILKFGSDSRSLSFAFKVTCVCLL